MANKMRILAVEDDNTSQLILKGMLAQYDIQVVRSGELALEEINKELPDLVIMDIGLPGIDGYETCRQLRAMPGTAGIPVVFLSSYGSLEDRMAAYGAGGNDYISKPFEPRELLTKIAQHEKIMAQQRQALEDLANSTGLLMEVQDTAAKLQNISRFIQTTLFCHSVDDLFNQFLKTARQIGIDCVLQIRSTDGIETRSTDGAISKLEQEIMDMSVKAERIHPFGRDRAIYNWKHASLLIRKLEGMIDTGAMFMDALESGIKAIEAEAALLQQAAELEKRNFAARDKVADMFEQMNRELQDAILGLGLAAVLDPEEEDKLAALVEKAYRRIDEQFGALAEINTDVLRLIGQLRSPPPEIAEQMKIPEPGDDMDGIMLF